MPSLFVSGTDTDCGKTHVATALLLALRDAGIEAAGYKPVSAGCELTDEGLRNADALALQAASMPGLGYEQVNPFAFAPPIAPHLAAADVGVRPTVAELLAGARALEAKSDWLVVEGAGGFMVPVNETESLADLVAVAGWPVILVVGMKLGCLNHALLSAESIARRSRLLGWVGNVLPPEQPRLDDNLDTLRARMPAPCLGVVKGARPQQAAQELDLEALRSALSCM